MEELRGNSDEQQTDGAQCGDVVEKLDFRESGREGFRWWRDSVMSTGGAVYVCV